MKFLKGLYKDSGLIDQPQGTHRDALNMVMNLDKGSISTEYGNIASSASATIAATLGEDVKINGSTLLPDNKFLLFYSTLYSTLQQSTSYIYLFDPEGDIITLLFATSSNPSNAYYNMDAGHLNFSPEYPITGEARVAANGDVIVYFTDNYKNIVVEPVTNIEYIDEHNPPRVFNITRQLNNLKDGATPAYLYDHPVGGKATSGTKHVDYLNLFLTTNKIPQIVSHKLVKGGILETGTYYLCLAYATEEFTETNVYTVSQPVYIPKGNYSYNGDGGANGITPAVPFEHMTGAPAGTQTNYGISWDYDRSDFDRDLSLDKNYPYLVPYIIKVSGNVKTAYKLPLEPIVTQGKITFSGNENYATSSVEAIVLDKATYLTAKTLTQLDNKLYLGNLTARKDIGFQRFAANIQTVPVVKPVPRFDSRVYDNLNLNYGYTKILKEYPETGIYQQDFTDYKLLTNYYSRYQLSNIYDATDFWTFDSETSTNIPATSSYDMGGYRNQKYASYLKSYRRGEVYALYISFVLNDGTETYAYHIPGRKKTTFTAYDGNGDPTTQPADEQYLDIVTGALAATDNSIYENDNGDYRRSSFRNADLIEKIGLYDYNKVYDTSKEVVPERATGADTDIHSMGYWSNTNEYYVDTNDFKIFDVDIDGTPIDTDTKLQGNVRHHKFPSNLNTEYSFIKLDRTNLYRIKVPSNPALSPNGQLESSMLVNLLTASANWDDQSNQTAFFYETINILGFKLKNIKIPKFILKQVQGFKVYYAKRTLENKTILGQSLVHPSFFRNHGFFSTSRLPLTEKVPGPFHRYWSFYANVADSLTADANAFIQYNSRFIGKYYYDAGEVTDADTYLGSPVVKFHDFTMLRKKINLDIVDYISIQSTITMHQFNGLLRNASRADSARTTITGSGGDPINNLTYLAGYKYFLTGQNENEEFSWIHADLNNLESKIVRATTAGKFDSFAPHRGPENFKANVLVGARYNSYYESGFTFCENSSSSFSNPFHPRALANVFALTTSGASYINGLTYLKIANVDSFHGAQYIDNYYGESGIVLSLKTGLPRLLGYVTDTDTYDSNQYDTVSKSGSIISALNTNENPDSTYSTLGRGKPNVFLANLHSYKTDVFNPFDNQTLVWTGYYQPLQITETSLETGAIGGVINCISFYNYDTVNIPENVSVESANNLVAITYDLVDVQAGHLDLTAFTSDGGTFIEGEVYNFSFEFEDISLLDTVGTTETVIISIGGGDEAIIDVSTGDTVFSGTILCGSALPYLRFDLGDETIYKAKIYLTITKDNPECEDTYRPGYLYPALINTPNVESLIYTYGDNNNYYTGLETGWIFGGDTFIARYNYRMTSSDFANYYLVQNKTADDGGNLSTITTGFGQQMSLPENIRTTLGPKPLTIPYNDYLGVVAFMNHRVVRSYGTDIWPNSSSTYFNLLQNFITLSTGSPILAGNPDGMYSLTNFKESSTFVANTTLYSVFVESDDNLNFRHAGDPIRGVGKEQSMFFDGYTAADVVFKSPLLDLTKQDNLLYEEHYSALQDIKTTVPFPKKGEIETAFPSRVIRSNVQDGRIDDNFRSFLALQYKDFSQNKGAITNLAVLNSLLFIHTEKALYKTTGKQTVQLGDTTEAFIGSGDIFAQEPIELVTANEGYGGTFNKHSCILNKYGYMYVSRKEKKVFLLTDKLSEISQMGMENWFRLNIPYTLETLNSSNPYPINLDSIPYLNLDAPTGSFGFVSTYDPLFKRFIITKRELIPSQQLIDLLLEHAAYPITGSDPGGCLNSHYSTLSNPSIPFGTGVDIINAADALITSYNAPYVDPAIWFDPSLGGYVFNTPLYNLLSDTIPLEIINAHVTQITLPAYDANTDNCITEDFYIINITNDNYWFKENGWTVSFYPDNQSWVSRHSYVSPWYFYNSENFFSFDSIVNSTTPSTFKIWKHNNTNGVKFYETNYNYEFEFVINDSPELTKILSSINFIADVYTKDESGNTIESGNTTYLKDRLNSYNIELPFKSFYIYNTYQNSGVTNFEYLNNIRKVEGSWMFNNFRDLVKYNKSIQLSDNQYNISGGFNNNVQTPLADLMFLGEGVVNPTILDNTKPWFEKKKFIAKFFGIRLIGQGNNNLVNLYSANASLRKSSR